MRAAALLRSLKVRDDGETPVPALGEVLGGVHGGVKVVVVLREFLPGLVVQDLRVLSLLGQRPRDLCDLVLQRRHYAVFPEVQPRHRVGSRRAFDKPCPTVGSDERFDHALALGELDQVLALRGRNQIVHLRPDVAHYH